MWKVQSKELDVSIEKSQADATLGDLYVLRTFKENNVVVQALLTFFES